MLNGTPAESFTQTFTYYHLGQPQQIGYPQCTHTGCAGTPAAAARTVENTFSQGLLSTVKVGTLTYGTLSYHPNLLVHQVTHANGVVETQTLDPNNMARPSALNAKLGTTTLWSTGPYAYDGAGNVTKTGAAWYLYDKVSRLVSSTLYDGATGGGTQKTQSYTFDPFGNMTAIGGTSARTTPTSAATNRLNGTGAVYDARGRLDDHRGLPLPRRPAPRRRNPHRHGCQPKTLFLSLLRDLMRQQSRASDQFRWVCIGAPVWGCCPGGCLWLQAHLRQQRSE